jgi:hypothetical protein
MTKRCQIWTGECEVATAIKAELDSDMALNYLIGEKFLDFLVASDHDPDIRTDIPAFVAEIKTLFERWQLVEYSEKGMLDAPTNRPWLGKSKAEWALWRQN